MNREGYIDLSTVSMQSSEPIKEIYCYRDFNRKKTEVFINDEIPIKLNIEKIAKKRLGIENYWKDVKDIFLKIENSICLGFL